MDRKNRFGNFKVLLVMSMVLACLSMLYVNVGAADSSDTKSFEESLRDTVYNIKHTSPLNEEIEDEEYVDPLTGNLTVSRTDLSLPGINGLDLELRRYHSATNAYLGPVYIDAPDFEYVCYISCKSAECTAHEGEDGLWTVVNNGYISKIYDWLTADEAEIKCDEYNEEMSGHEVGKYDASENASGNASGPYAVRKYFNYSYDALEKSPATQPYALDSSWAYDFPYVEKVVENNKITATYLHLGSRGVWKVNLGNDNGLDGYGGNDVCFEKYENGGEITYKYYEKTGLTYTFDGNGLIKEISNQYDNKILFTCGNNNRITQIIDSCGRVVQISDIVDCTPVPTDGEEEEEGDEDEELFEKEQTVSVSNPAGTPSKDKGGIDSKEIKYYYKKTGAIRGLNMYKLVAAYGDVKEDYHYKLVPMRYNRKSINIVEYDGAQNFKYSFGKFPEESDEIIDGKNYQERREEYYYDVNRYFGNAGILNSLYLDSIQIEGSGCRVYEYDFNKKKKLCTDGAIEFAKVSRIFDLDEMPDEETDVDITTGKYNLSSDEVYNETKYEYKISIKEGDDSDPYEFDGFNYDAFYGEVEELEKVSVEMKVTNDGKISTTVTNGLGFLEQTVEENTGNEKVTTVYTNDSNGLPKKIMKTTSKGENAIYTSYENYVYNEYGDVTAYYKPSAPRNADGSIDTSKSDYGKYCIQSSYLQKTPGDNGLLFSYLLSNMYYNDANTIMREEYSYASNNTLSSTVTKKLEIGEDNGFVAIRKIDNYYRGDTYQIVSEVDYIDYAADSSQYVVTNYSYGTGAGDKSQVVRREVRYNDSENEITETEYDYLGNEIKSKDELGVTSTTEYSETIALGAENFESSTENGEVEGNTTVSTAIDTTTYETTTYDTDLDFTATTDQYGRREVSINAPNGNEVLSYSSDSGMLTLNKYDNNSKVILEKVYIVKGSKDVSDSELKRISNAFYTTSANPTSTLRTYEQYSVAEYRYNSVGELVEKKEKGSGSEYISFDTYSTTVSKTNDGHKCTQSSTIEFKPNEVASGDSLLRQKITKTYTDKNERTIKTESQTVKFFNGNPKVVTTTTVNEYDDISDRLTKVTTTYTDNSGNTETNVTEYEYDYLGNQSQVIREDGTSNLTEYNALGQAVRSYDYVSMSLPKDERYYTQTEYYHNGSVKKTTVPIDDNTNQTTLFIYDAAGNTIRETVSREDGKSEVTEYEYDAGNRLTTVINYTEEPRGLSQGKKQITQYLYDPDGNEIRRYTGLTEKLHIELTKIHDPYATASPSASPTPTPTPVELYDEVVEEYKKGEAIYSIRVGFEEEAHVQGYRVSKYQYDLENKLTSFTDPDGRTETYTYDFKGNLEKTVDKEGNVTTNTYDTRQRLIKSVVKDAEGKDENIITNYTYNTLNELESVNDKTYTYDTMSRITKIVDEGLLPNKAVTTEYGYRVDGVQTSKKISVGNAVKLHQKYSYDPIDRLSTVYDVEDGTESSIVSYQYDNNGNRKVEGSSGKVVYYTYNYNNQVTELMNVYQGKGVSRYQYTYNQGGYQDSETETIANYGAVSPELVGSKTTTYQYDLLGRLTREATGEDSIAYEYDKYNNRSSMIVTQNAVDKTTNYQYNKNDELLSETTTEDGENKQITNYWYDLNGNQIAKSYANVVTNGVNVVVPIEPSSAVPEASASVSATAAPDTTVPETDATEENNTEVGSTGITIQATTDNPEGAQPQLTEYDALNRQTKVKIGNDVYKYGYNEDGLRTWKEVNGEKTYFVWDNDQIVLELDENGAVNKKHVRGLTLLYSEDDNSATNDKVFYNYNAHGDVVQLLDVNGNVTKYYQYDSFGNEINEDESDQNPWRYSGEYYDKETKTIYLRARYYNPGYGRFTTRDTYTGEQNDPLSLNLYTYCENEPVMNVDPSGHKRKTTSFEKSEIKRLRKNGPKYRPKTWNDGRKNLKKYYKSERHYPCRRRHTQSFTLDRHKIQYTTNCYAYAFDYKKNPETQLMFEPAGCELCPFGMTIGMFYRQDTSSILQDYVNAVTMDMMVLHVDFLKVPEKKENVPYWTKTAYIVAFACDNIYYHWYRLDGDGKWSHKMSYERVKRTKNGGKNLPTEQYQKDGYSEFLGYFYVRKRG